MSTPTFPRGMVSRDDEGQTSIIVVVIDHLTKGPYLRIEFEKPIYWLGMGKEEALALGRAIIKNAEKMP